VGLGAALAGMGRRAAVVDCNLDNPHLHRMLGESNFVGLTSGLDGGKSLEHFGYEASPAS
jgi:Mrp family chromosome partitioning ATPase